MPTIIYLHLEILHSNAQSIDQLAESFGESFIEQNCQIKKKQTLASNFSNVDVCCLHVCKYLCVLK